MFWKGSLVRMLKDRKGSEIKQATSHVRPTARYECPAAGDQPVGWRISWWRSSAISTREKMDTVTDMHWTKGVTCCQNGKYKNTLLVYIGRLSRYLYCTVVLYCEIFRLLYIHILIFNHLYFFHWKKQSTYF